MDFGALNSYSLSGQKAELQFEGGTASVELVAPGIVNVFVPLAGAERRSKAIEGDKSQPVTYTAGRRPLAGDGRGQGPRQRRLLRGLL